MKRLFWKAGGTQPRGPFVVVPIGLLILAIFVISNPQHLNPEEQYREDQAMREFTEMVRYEARAMETWLRVALDEEVPCDGPCNRDEDFSNIVSGLIIRCERFGPEDQEQSPYYRRDLHGEDLERLKAACSILTDMAKTAPGVSESPDWVEAVSRARAVFE